MELIYNDGRRGGLDFIMSTTRIIYDSKGKLAEFEDDYLIWSRNNLDSPSRSFNVIRDIDPYKSMITGEMIDSRSKHREHLRKHNCIEVGNEKMETKIPAYKDNRRELLHKQLGDMSDRQANKILKQLRG